jgi:hypothetical protein
MRRRSGKRSVRRTRWSNERCVRCWVQDIGNTLGSGNRQQLCCLRCQEFWLVCPVLGAVFGVSDIGSGLSPGMCRILESATTEARSATGGAVRPGPPETWAADPGLQSPASSAVGGCESYPSSSYSERGRPFGVVLMPLSSGAKTHAARFAALSALLAFYLTSLGLQPPGYVLLCASRLNTRVPQGLSARVAAVRDGPPYLLRFALR